MNESIGRRPNMRENLKSNRGALTTMLAAVALQVAGALVLKTIADNRLSWPVATLVIGIGAVVIINLIRLGVWGYAHSKFPLSKSFPFSSLFYPAMLLVAWIIGDTIGARQIIGAATITMGSVWLASRVPA